MQPSPTADNSIGEWPNLRYFIRNFLCDTLIAVEGDLFQSDSPVIVDQPTTRNGERLTPEFLGELGRIDIVLAPIDGMWTMSHEELFEVLGRIKPPLIIPMHFGSMGGVDAFIAKARKLWPVRQHSESWIQLSIRDLPHRTEILFLKGGY